MGFITPEDQRERQEDIEDAGEEGLGTGFPRTVEELEESDAPVPQYDGTLTGKITSLWKVEVRLPPFDEPNISGEFLGKDLTPEIFEKITIETFREATNNDQKAKVLYYWRYERAFAETGAKMRARIFTRALHPLRFDKIHTKGVGKLDGDTVVITAINL